MIRPIGIFLLLILFSDLRVLGQSAPFTGISMARLQWDAAHGQELARGDAVRFSKELTAEERAGLTRFFTEDLRPSMNLLDIHSDRELREVAEDTQVKLVDLNGDGTREVIVQGWGKKSGCGVTGNCPFSVLEKTDRGYRTILNATAQVFTVEETRSDTFRNLVLGLHDSASESELLIYRYKNGRYRKTGCYEANWSPSVVGPPLKKPVITRCSR